MNRIYQAFLILLRSGLWNQTISDFSLFPLNQREWELLYKESVKQTVQGIVYQGLKCLDESLLPPETILMVWLVEIDRVERKNQQIQLATSQLYTFFSQISITPILMKGDAVGVFYNQPLLRVPGDVDFFFRTKKDYERAAEYLKTFHVELHNNPDESKSYIYEGVLIEHHKNLFDLLSPGKRNILRQLQKQYGFAEIQIADKITAITPHPILTLILLNVHIMKHALTLGVGLRQLCDLAIAYDKISRKMDISELENIYRRLGLVKWSNLLHSFLVKYLRLSKDKLPYNGEFDDCERLLEIVLSGGNFGFGGNKMEIQTRNRFYRKLLTFKKLMSNFGFALKYSGVEEFYRIYQLLIGQFN